MDYGVITFTSTYGAIYAQKVLRPAADVLMFAHKYGSAFHLTADPAEGIQDADVVATAVWNTAKPGTPESEQRLRDFVGFQLTGKLLESAKPDVMVLHCLPAHRGEEISTALFEQHADEIFDEAENRLHVQKAVLAVLLAALANGFSISLFKRYAEGEDTLTLCGYQFIMGGGLLLLTGLCFGGTLPHFTGQSLLLLGYMVLLSAVAQTIWSALTRYNPVGRVAVYGFLNPVFGVLLSALLLREGQQAFTPYSLAALVLVCVGIFVVNRSDTPGRGVQADQQP